MLTSEEDNKINRPSLKFLSEFVQCPCCKGKLFLNQTSIFCLNCKERFCFFRGKPVLIRKNHELFSSHAYTEKNNTDGLLAKKAKIKKIISGLIPSSSINLARHAIYKNIAKRYGMEGNLILVIGCGGQAEEFRIFFAKTKATYVFCDIDKNADVDIFCDAHELIFQDEKFDGVITTAVLEHVISPEKVVAEIHRILKLDGFVYSEIPFLQCVHEGAYDFTRYTMTGHRILFQKFREEQSGIVAGPATALVWSLIGFAKSFFASPRKSQLAALCIRGLFFWLKYLDYIVKNNVSALDSASCTFFFGNKIRKKTLQSNIIKRYEGSNILHL